MKELDLPKLEEYYMDKVRNRFKKERKVFDKLFQSVQKEFAEALNTLKNWGNIPRKKGQVIEPLDEKSKAVMDRFIEHIVETINGIKIPLKHIELTWESVNSFCESVKKLYQTYNEQGRKSIPKFIKQYELEIKDIDLHLRNLGDLTQKIATFLRQNYQDGKVAESLIEKIPRLSSLIERVSQTKSQLETAEKELNLSQTNLKNFEEKLYAIDQDPLILELEQLERNERNSLMELDDQLKFKKAIKKLWAMLDKMPAGMRGISESELRPYAKNLVEVVLEQAPKTQGLKDLLLKVRILVEDENDPLQLKGELKPKILANIHDIVNQNLLEPILIPIQQLRTKKQSLQKSIAEKGYDTLRIELKDKIADLTVEVEHQSNDLNRRKREYRELLERIVADRDDLQKSVKQQINEDIKLNVIIPQ